MNELLMNKAAYVAGDEVAVEVRSEGLTSGEIVITRLGVEVSRFPIQDRFVELGVWQPGGYGVSWFNGGSCQATSAFRVEEFAGSRLCYGFVSDYPAEPDLVGMSEFARRLHLNAVQFYDWAFRHADLVGNDKLYRDPLGREVHQDSVAKMVRSYAEVGTTAHGYAAVYAVGDDEWDRWSGLALLDAEQNPFELAGFLKIIDCSDPAWLTHFTDDLREAGNRLGFTAFHLDQYGQPKWAQRADGKIVDLEQSFGVLVRHVADAVPEARLVFNNVNDFPSWASVSWPQAAVYIEPWAPNDTLGSLARLITAARNRGSLPVCLAAYQSVYRTSDPTSADLATQFTLATCFSHGATQLLAGQTNAILVDPYYVNHLEASDETVAILTAWYDFAAEWDELLFDSAITDVTSSHTGPYNDDIDVTFPGVGVTDEPSPGQLWRRVTRTRYGDVVHIINLVSQTDTLWDAPKTPPESVGPGNIRIRRRYSGRLPKIQVLAPGQRPQRLDVVVQGTHAVAELPSPSIWQVIHIVDN